MKNLRQILSQNMVAELRTGADFVFLLEILFVR